MLNALSVHFVMLTCPAVVAAQVRVMTPPGSTPITLLLGRPGVGYLSYLGLTCQQFIQKTQATTSDLNT